jgi:hypothetical protein
MDLILKNFRKKFPGIVLLFRSGIFYNDDFEGRHKWISVRISLNIHQRRKYFQHELWARIKHTGGVKNN